MDKDKAVESLSKRTRDGIGQILSGKSMGLRSIFLMAGPAVIASIAYVDPGNYATNIEAGASYGYKLLWVVFFANMVAMLFQALSAKVGIVTGRNLAELCYDHFSKPVRLVLWAISEVCAMATDLAEFLGGAIGFSLLLHLPLLVGMIITAILTYAILLLEQRGFRPLEILISILVGAIFLCYLGEMILAPVDWAAVGLHMFKPEVPSTHALFVAVGIVGATVMPHAIYLHSGLMQDRAHIRNDDDRAKLIRYSNWEVVIALALAGMVNMAMVIMAASVFHGHHNDIAEIETAYKTLMPLLGMASASLYLISLLMSGISSSVVGTLAGQIIMQGFLGFKIPLWVRRLVTMLPAFIVVGLGIDATQSLLLSQVILSIALPIPMITLLLFTGRKSLMGRFVNTPLVQFLAMLFAAIILVLNFLLLYLTATGQA